MLHQCVGEGMGVIQKIVMLLMPYEDSQVKIADVLLELIC